MANTAIAGRQARKNMKAQFGYDTKKAAQQFQYDTQAWERTNLYNSPEQVMARYKAAGLNPNLIYGGGMGNTAGSAPAQEAVAPDARHLPPTMMLPSTVLSEFQDFTMKRVQTDNLKKQSQILEEERINKNLQNQWLSRSMQGRLENLTEEYLGKSRKRFEMMETWPFRYEREGLSNKQIEARIRSLSAGSDLAEQKKIQLESLFPGQLEMQGLNLEKTRRGLNLLQLQKLSMQAKIDYQKMVNEYYEEMFYLQAGKSLAQGAAPIVDMLINYGKSKAKGQAKPYGRIGR